MPTPQTYKIIKPSNTQQITGIDINRVQMQIEKTLNPIASAPIVNGVLMTGLELEADYVNLIEHGLGRAANYIIVGKNTFIMDCLSPDTTIDQTLFLPLIVSMDATVSIWCF